MAVQVGPEGAREAPRGAMSSFQIPIFCASQSGSAECVALLLQAGADPNARDSSGETPLMVAGSGAVVQALLGAGADLLAVEQYGKDALEAILEESCVGGALGPERFAVARAMLDAGAGIERVDGFGKARLASAAFGHHSDAVDFLLGLGARADALDSQGGTPLHAICWQGEYSNVERSRACERIIRSLVAAGASVHARDLQGRTPMHQAAGGDMGNPTAIRTLLELGADADPVDDRGDTPLMSAVFESETECVRLLLAAGADPTRKGEDGRFVLDIARDQVQVWESIVASGPDIERAKALQLRNKRFAEKYPSGRGLGPTDLSALMNDEAESHRDALETAIETLRVIEDAMRTRGGEWDGNADPNS